MRSPSHQNEPRSHLAPFAEGPRAWLVVARNAVPVLGVYILNWSTDFVLFQIWFDGIAALGAMIAFQMRGFARNGGQSFDAPSGVPHSARAWVLSFVWLVIILLLGIPYWFVLFFFGMQVIEDGFWLNLFRDAGLMTALFVALLSNVIEESRRGYERMNDKEIRLEFNWEFSIHLARITALILVPFALRLGMIVVLALALSYIEIYPLRTLRFLGGDQTLDSENETRSPD